jgi:hypothetical protein
VNTIADLGAYLLMVLGVAAIYTAGFMLWTPAAAGPGPTWKPWVLVVTGAVAACAAAVLT